MKQLVKLHTRLSCDGKSFQYVLRYVDENGKRKGIHLEKIEDDKDGYG